MQYAILAAVICLAVLIGADVAGCALQATFAHVLQGFGVDFVLEACKA